jgi:hypothetical protein
LSRRQQELGPGDQQHSSNAAAQLTGEAQQSSTSMAMFIWLIIRLIQLVFSAGTVFFSHKKSANSVFQPAYNSSRTAPMQQEQCSSTTHW